MQLVDPTSNDPGQSHARAPALSSLEGKTIGLLSNSKLNADVLLKETAALFQAEYRCKIGDVRSSVTPARQRRARRSIS